MYHSRSLGMMKWRQTRFLIVANGMAYCGGIFMALSLLRALTSAILHLLLRLCSVLNFLFCMTSQPWWRSWRVSISGITGGRRGAKWCLNYIVSLMTPSHLAGVAFDDA